MTSSKNPKACSSSRTTTSRIRAIMTTKGESESESEVLGSSSHQKDSDVDTLII